MKKLLNLFAAGLLLILCADARADITSNLALYWALDDGSGTSATDGSGNTNTGTLVNTPTWAAGKVGTNSLTFNGTTQNVSRADTASLSITGAITIAFWINPTATISATGGCGCIVFVSKAGNAGNGYEVIYDKSKGLILGLNDSGGFRDWDLAVSLTGGVWTHVVFTWDGSSTTTAVGYINGSSVSGSKGGDAGNFALADNAVALCLAKWCDGGADTRYFAGSLDEVRVYSRALSSGDVTELYNYGLSVVGGFNKRRKLEAMDGEL